MWHGQWQCPSILDRGRGECDAIKPLFWLAECEILDYHEAFDVTYGWEALRAIDKFMNGEMNTADILPLLTAYSRYPISSKNCYLPPTTTKTVIMALEYEKYRSTLRRQWQYLRAPGPAFPGLFGTEKNRIKHGWPSLRRILLIGAVKHNCMNFVKIARVSQKK